MNRSQVLKLLIPVAGILLIGGVVLLRSGGASVPPPTPPKPAKAPVAAMIPSQNISAAPRPVPPPPPAPEAVIARATDDARLRGTYQNFRTAVATKNTVLEDSLRKVLARDRDAALGMAQDELNRATAPLDREIALKTLESLRK